MQLPNLLTQCPTARPHQSIHAATLADPGHGRTRSRPRRKTAYPSLEASKPTPPAIGNNSPAIAAADDHPSSAPPAAAIPTPPTSTTVEPASTATAPPLPPQSAPGPGAIGSNASDIRVASNTPQVPPIVASRRSHPSSSARQSSRNRAGHLSRSSRDSSPQGSTIGHLVPPPRSHLDPHQGAARRVPSLPPADHAILPACS